MTYQKKFHSLRKPHAFDSWSLKLLAVICSLAMVITLMTPAIIYGAEPGTDQAILDFEGTNPVAYLDVDQDQTIDDSRLPQSIPAVYALNEETEDPDDFTASQPDQVPETYELLQDDVYSVETLTGVCPLRVYGTLNGWTGWFSLDPQTAKINGIVQDTDLNWNTENVDTSIPGTSYIEAGVDNSDVESILPLAQVTVSPIAESDDDSDNPSTFSPCSGQDQPDSDQDDTSKEQNKDPEDNTSDKSDQTSDSQKDHSSSDDPNAADKDSDPDGTGSTKTDTSSDADQSGKETNESTDTLYDCNNHTLTWQAGSDHSVIDGTVLTNETKINGESTGQVTAHLCFSFSGSEAIQPGDIRIILPLHILKGRKGQWVDTITLPFPNVNQGDSATGFAYQEDTENNEVIITNTKPFSSGNFLEADVTYSFSPYSVANGTESSDLQARFEILDQTTHQIVVDKTSQILTAVIHSTVPSPKRLRKDVLNTREVWNPEWGEEPEDADEYIYTSWIVTGVISMGTQPFIMYGTDQPGANGQIVGWYEPDVKPSKETFIHGDSHDLTAYSICKTSSDQTGNGTRRHYMVIVVRTPKDQIHDKEKLTNDFAVNVIGIDGDRSNGKCTGSYIYRQVNFDYGGDGVGVEKTNLKSSYGAVNLIHANKAFQPWENDGQVQPFDIALTSRGYNISRKSTKDYTSTLDDYIVFLGDERLNSNDYCYTAFSPDSYTKYVASEDPNEGLIGVADDDYKSYEPVDVYTTTGDGESDSAWTKYGTLTQPEKDRFCWNGTSIGKDQKIGLPEGTTGVSFRQTGKQYQVDLKMKLYYELLPSDHVEMLLKNKTIMELFNIASGYQGLPGKGLNTDSKRTDSLGALNHSSDQSIKKQIQQLDHARFGSSVAHACGIQWLMGYLGVSQANKYMKGTTNNKEKGRFEIHYELSEWDALVSEGGEGREYAVENGMITEQTNGIFYDLLPAGTVPDTDSIQAYGFAGKTIYPHTLQLIPNWENSGRTMMVVKVQKPVDADNVFIRGSNICTGMIVTYTLIDPWENVLDNGAQVLNSFVFESLDGKLFNGVKVVKDDDQSITDRHYYTDLPDESQPDATNKLYAQVKQTLSADLASVYGFSKQVRSVTQDDYADTATLCPGQEYVYKLRYASSGVQEYGNVVMYDILENAPGKTSDWKGSFKDIDVSQLTNQGAAPVVYYSTKTGMNPGDGTEDPSLFDLSNSSIWSVTPPEDLSQVTAVAVDVSKDQDGKPFLFKRGNSGTVLIYMEAPEDAPLGEAFDTSYISQTPQGESKRNVEMSNQTSVKITAPDLKLTKTSDPASGTASNPTLISPDEQIVYYLNITNDNAETAARKIVVSDQIDSSLIADAGKISCTLYPEGLASTGTSADDQVKFSLNGSHFEAVVDRLDAGATMQIAIPTTINPDLLKEPDGKQILIENQAVLEKAGQIVLNSPSDKTYHKAVLPPDPAQASITFNKKLIAADEDSEHNQKVLKDGEFSFELCQKTDDGSAQTIQTTSNSADGTVAFDALTFDQAGTYTYTVHEVSGDEDGITYDQANYPVTITVTDENGKLKANIVYPNGSTITNRYTVKKQEPSEGIDIDGQKDLKNGTLESGQFTFTLNGEGVSQSVTNDANGQFSFHLPGYTTSGTYTYLIRETDDGQKNVVYDQTSYQAVVEVTANKSGNLEAHLTLHKLNADGSFTTDDTAADKALFVNSVSSSVKTAEPTRTTGTSQKNTGHSTQPDQSEDSGQNESDASSDKTPDTSSYTAWIGWIALLVVSFELFLYLLYKKQTNQKSAK